jgi:hypothetical protein
MYVFMVFKTIYFKFNFNLYSNFRVIIDNASSKQVEFTTKIRILLNFIVINNNLMIFIKREI